MHDLEKQTMENFDAINQLWVNSLLDAKKNNVAVDLTTIIGKISGITTKQLQSFRDYKERLAKPQRKGIFG